MGIGAYTSVSFIGKCGRRLRANNIVIIVITAFLLQGIANKVEILTSIDKVVTKLNLFSEEFGCYSVIFSC